MRSVWMRFIQPRRHNLDACHPWLKRPQVNEYSLVWMNIILWDDPVQVLVGWSRQFSGCKSDGGWTFYKYHPVLMDSFSFMDEWHPRSSLISVCFLSNWDDIFWKHLSLSLHILDVVTCIDLVSYGWTSSFWMKSVVGRGEECNRVWRNGIDIILFGLTFGWLRMYVALNGWKSPSCGWMSSNQVLWPGRHNLEVCHPAKTAFCMSGLNGWMNIVFIEWNAT